VSKRIPLGEIESYLSLGSNLGDRLGYLKEGLDLVLTLPDTNLLKISAVYETEPVDFADQPRFLNLAACIHTKLEPHELLHLLKDLERKIGRVHRDRWSAREIDIDIIFYGDYKIDSDDLIIPHPRAHLRKFVLQPLSEIAPEFRHPVAHKTVEQLLKECVDNSSVTRLEELSTQPEADVLSKGSFGQRRMSLRLNR